MPPHLPPFLSFGNILIHFAPKYREAASLQKFATIEKAQAPSCTPA